MYRMHDEWCITQYIIHCISAHREEVPHNRRECPSLQIVGPSLPVLVAGDVNIGGEVKMALEEG